MSKEQLNNLDKKIEKQTARSVHINMYHVFLLQGLNAKGKNNASAIDFLMRSLNCANECEMEYEKIDEIIQHILSIVHSGNATRPQINPKDARRYSHIIKAANYDDTQLIISILHECINSSTQSQTENWKSIIPSSKNNMSWT